MPETKLQTLQLRPGLNREGTSYAGEGGWYACDKVRFRSGLPEKIGGWAVYGESTYNGICRHYAEWVSLSDFYLLGVGTNSNYYILTGNEYFNITPIAYTDLLNTPPRDPVHSMWSTLASSVTALNTVLPITNLSGGNYDLLVPLVVQIGSELIYVPAVDTVAGTLGTSASPCTRGYLGTTAAAHALGTAVTSTWLIIYDPYNQATAGDFVILSGATGVADLLSTETLNVLLTEDGYNLIATETNVVPDPYPVGTPDGSWEILAANSNYFAIDSGITSTAPAQWGGDAMVAQFTLPAGSPYEGVTNGWGAGPWNSSRAWNQAYPLTSPAAEIRLWSAGNFGQNLFFCARNEGIFFWDASVNLNSVGQVTGRAVNITSTTASNVTLDQIVVGNFYAIRDLGTTTQLQWNLLAGTTGVTYAPYPAPSGSVDRFTCADVIASGYGTGIVYDAAIPSVASSVIVTDERYVVAFGSNDAVTEFTNGTPVEQDPLYIAWCSQEQPQVWWPTSTNTAGNYRLAYGSKIVTVEKTRQETLVFTDTALISMQFLGAPYVYGFTPLSVDITIVGPNAATTTNGITYWMGQDKFYAYSGRVDTLPCALRQYVFDDINTAQFSQVYAGTNEKYNEIWWQYPSSNSLVNDRYVIYNYLEKVWYYGNLSRTAWLDSHIIGNPIAAVPNSTNILAPSGITVQHEIGADDGSVNPIQPISAYIESSDFDLGDGGYRFAFVKRIIPDVDFIGSTVTVPTATMTLMARNYPGVGLSGSPMQDAVAPISGAEVSIQVYDYTPEVWVRIRGRQMAFRIESEQLGVKWQLGVPRLQIQSDGRR